MIIVKEVVRPLDYQDRSLSPSWIFILYFIDYSQWGLPTPLTTRAGAHPCSGFFFSSLISNYSRGGCPVPHDYQTGRHPRLDFVLKLIMLNTIVLNIISFNTLCLCRGCV